MQLLHCYDVVSGRASPWEGLFDKEDWLGFEYLRDSKYFYCEGYGRKNVHLLAVPWLEDAINSLLITQQHSDLGRSAERQLSPKFPLQVGFTHREEVLYLCCLLGIHFRPHWYPSLSSVDSQREWRVSSLAPYLGHVGIECYGSSAHDLFLRIVVNGEVKSAFRGEFTPDTEGGYALQDVNNWLQKRKNEYIEVFDAGSLSFLSKEEA